MAMHLFTLLGALSTLTATGYALTCTKCMALGGDSCTEGLNDTCSSNQVCMSVYTVTISGGKPGDFLSRSCGLQSQCNRIGSFSIPGKVIKMGITCCSTDFCVPKLANLPSDNTQKNGLKCASCETDSGPCQSDEKMECMGTENKCLTRISKTTGGFPATSYTYGCTTKSICDIGEHIISFPTFSISGQFICNSGPAIVSHGSFLIMLSVFALLIKLI
ncbi:phospholipase A2 inhibitor NAI-like [Pelobates fuscus]|uniref:phospholipase A2 inhibitor NAI-like n=1 Tax=Pelobates fuscus TaxID=191477 RepID=UPI002FE49546